MLYHWIDFEEIFPTSIHIPTFGDDLVVIFQSFNRGAISLSFNGGAIPLSFNKGTWPLSCNKGT